jgi:peptidoglycan/LPS O-acetylase OafA/YrhL
LLRSGETLKEHKEFGFITLLRVTAVFLITWDHLVGTWLDNNKISWLPLNLVRQYVTQPLGIIQDFGFIGVVLIFLITGFIITHVAQAESRKEFIIKRLFRIYPPLILSIILIFAFYGLYSLTPQSPTFIQNFNLKDILLASTLLNYFMVPQNAINGVAWILVVEVIFYVASFFLLPLLNKRPKLSMTLLIAFAGFTSVLAKQFGPNFFLFAVAVTYIPYIILGQILYYFWKQRITKIEFAIFSTVTALVSIYGIMVTNVDFLSANNSYIVSFTYAYIIFVIALLLAKRIKIGRFFDFYSKISYSFYLNQGVSLLFITALFPLIGFEFSFAIAFVALTLLAYLSWRFVEKFSRNFAQKILAIS